LHLDRGYDSNLTMQRCHGLRLTDIVCAKKKRKGEAKIKKPLTLGLRRPVERTNSWFSNFGQLRRNTDRLLTDTPGGGNDIAALELRHRQHARVADRIRAAKDRGMPNLPCQDFHANSAWVELAPAADLSTWAQALCFTGELRRVEPKRLRYRVLHVAGRLVRTGRRLILRLDMNWPWAHDLARAFTRLRAAPWPT